MAGQQPANLDRGRPAAATRLISSAWANVVNVVNVVNVDDVKSQAEDAGLQAERTSRAEGHPNFAECRLSRDETRAVRLRPQTPQTAIRHVTRNQSDTDENPLTRTGEIRHVTRKQSDTDETR